MSQNVLSRPDLLDWLDVVRLDASARLDRSRRSELGQFFTPVTTARLMASLFTAPSKTPHLLDAGAGIGSLTAAWVAAMCRRPSLPDHLTVTAFEVDPSLQRRLEDTLEACRKECEAAGIGFDACVRIEDFVTWGAEVLQGGLFSPPRPLLDCAILNPPYKKIRSDSQTRKLLRSIGIETSNLYTAFLAVSAGLLSPGGELVAITPRSFCNGPYFRPFRKSFFSTMGLTHLHVFNARDHAFAEYDVLQENLILRAVKATPSDSVTIISSTGPDTSDRTVRVARSTDVVRGDDPDGVIWIVTDDRSSAAADRMRRLTTQLQDLDLSVSTGRVVDFRAKAHLRAEPADETVPLIYPSHFNGGYVKWPKPRGRKPNALAFSAETRDLVVPPGAYVLTRRFSAKEERRRIVACVYDSDRVSSLPVGFENHLNYFHRHGAGLPLQIAKGLAAFLNSSLVDSYFRQFNGHTQVNAADLRVLPYPSLVVLDALGALIGDRFPDQEDLDRIIDQELF